MRYKTLQHEDWSYGMILYDRIVKIPCPVLLPSNFSIEKLENIFSDFRAKEEILEGWKLIDVELKTTI